MFPTLGIIGYSTRALVQAAVELGYRAVSLDAFADQDTLDMANCCQRIEQWPLGILPLAKQVQVDAWLLAGGMEHDAALVNELQTLAPVLGPSGPELARLRALNNWQRVTTQLIGLDFPPCDFVAEPRQIPVGWLKKEFRSSGGLGVHSRPISPTSAIAKPIDLGSIQNSSSGEPLTYLQQRIMGRSLGVTWIFHASGPQLLGVTESLDSSNWPGPSEFIYRGSLGPISLTASQTAVLHQLAQRVAHVDPEFRGWLQADFIEDHARKLWLLEFNPRWTAGMEILHATASSREQSPLAQHLAAWNFPQPFRSPSQVASEWPNPHVTFSSKAIHYAATDNLLSQPQRRHLCSLRTWQDCPERSGCGGAAHGLSAQWSLADLPPVDSAAPMRFEPGYPILTVRTRLLHSL